MAEREEKSSPFCFTNQASCMSVSRGRKQTTKSCQCHPGYKGNIVKHVSDETTIEQLYCRRCQTKYMTIKCNEDGGNFQLGTPF